MASDTDISTQRATYQGLLGFLKWGGVISLLIAFFVLWLLRG